MPSIVNDTATDGFVMFIFNVFNVCVGGFQPVSFFVPATSVPIVYELSLNISIVTNELLYVNVNTEVDVRKFL